MFDYHNHTSFSDDSQADINEMIQRAADLCIEEIAITDHYDPGYPDTHFPFGLDFDAYHEALENCSSRYKDTIKVVKGIEIGLQHGDILDECSRTVNTYPYDFVIGSFHCVEGIDLNCRRFFTDKSPEEAYKRFYLYVHSTLQNYQDYDVLGHINVIDRYVDEIPHTGTYSDIVEAILMVLVDNSKGLEINTSSFRYNMNEITTPMQWMLDRYVELGGETITTGSDAHKPADVGHKLDFAEEMIRRTGLKDVATFDRRMVTYRRL